MSDDAEDPLPLRLPLLVTTESLRLCIRPVTPADREEIRRGLQSISPETMYRRFFVSAFSPDDRELQYLTEVDGENHVAVGAIDCAQDPPKGTGVARYVRLPEEPTVAEAAIVVIDAYQGQGIGSLLMAALNKRAAECGIERFRGYVLVENTGMIEVLRALGASETSAEDGVLRMDAPVYPDLRDLPADPELERVRWAWRTIETAGEGDCESMQEDN
jgi:RimJ/RimL family protein N-acetyltransferase